MEEKIYFIPGDIVTLRQNIPNKPIMIVLKKENYIRQTSLKVVQKEPEGLLKGIKCR